MDIIKEIIGETRKPQKGVTRLAYDYDLKIAGQVWTKLYKLNIEGDRELQIDKIWNQLILWAMGDAKCNFKLTKGIALTGSTGLGKTTAMQTLLDFILVDDIKYLMDKKYYRLKYNIINARKIVSDYEDKGYNGLFKYYRMGGLMIDDLGTESRTAKYYGTELDVIEDVIERRYDKNLFTHFTSNLDINKIHKVYGDRVYSRIMHKCNIIEMQGIDYRLI